MSDTRTNLVYMANQIARNFAVHGDEAAIAATADHIATFWDPRMKAVLLADQDGLCPNAAAAFSQLASGCTPAHQSAATQFGGPQSGDGSDAG